MSLSIGDVIRLRNFDHHLTTENRRGHEMGWTPPLKEETAPEDVR